MAQRACVAMDRTVAGEAMSIRLWIAADVLSGDGRVWELIGVFDSEALADMACTQPNHCIFSVILNERLPDESVIPRDARYPRSDVE